MIKSLFTPSEVKPKKASFLSKLYENAQAENGSIFIAGADLYADQVRQAWNALSWRFGTTPILDLGNLHIHDPKDKFKAIREVTAELLEAGKTILWLGGESADYKGILASFKSRMKDVQMSAVLPNIPLHNKSWLSKILLEKSPQLFNAVFMGSQNYLVQQSELDWLEKVYFENHRLGLIRNAISDCESLWRDSQLGIMSLDAVRNSDYPNSLQNPNGLYAEEMVQLSYFAGLSAEIQCLAMMDLSPKDPGQLTAQMAWYFIDGFTQRRTEYPTTKSNMFVKYTNKLPSSGHEIVFVQSKQSQRWWFLLENPKSKKPYFVSCNYQDYIDVCNDKIPYRWFKAYQRIM